MFLVGMLLLSLGATPYSKAADLTLIGLRLSVVLILSVLVVRERWRARPEADGKTPPARDVGSTVLQRFRRWYYDEDNKAE